MKRLFKTAAALAALLAAGTVPAQSTSTTKSGLRVTDLTFSPQEWTHGYIENRYVVENPTPLRRTVTLELPGDTYPGSQGLQSLAGTVTLEAGAKAVLSLPQPPVALAGSHSVGVLADGAKKESVPCDVHPFQNYASRETPSVLVSKALSAETLKEWLLACAPDDSAASPAAMKRVPRPSPRSSRFTRQNMTEFKPFRFEREASAWSPNWLAYTGFDGCVVAADDYAKMTEEVRAALRAYVAAGGQVTFLGARQLPEGWSDTGSKAAAPVLTAGGNCEAPFGFGRVQALATGDLKQITSNQVAWLAESWYDRKAPLAQPTERTYSYRPAGVAAPSADCLTEIPVKSGLRVPVNLFLLILLAFALIAGPGVVVYAGRINRRIWLLWLVPAVSVAFSAAILVFAFASEGITPTVRCQAVTLLDQTRRQAVTLGAVGVYAPLSVSDGLQFDRASEVTPLSRNEAQGNKRIAWGQRQHFTAGWVVPRMPAFFRVRRSEERAERLIVTEQGDGAVEVVNMLGVPVSRLLLCDSREWTYEALSLAPGEKRALTPSGRRGKTAPAAAERIRELCLTAAPGWGIESLSEKLLGPKWQEAGVPAPGSYVAVLDGCPFIENPLRYGKFKGTSKAVVVGTF